MCYLTQSSASHVLALTNKDKQYNLNVNNVLMWCFSIYICRFLRSVAYREFIHLVYDRVGKMRIPLPACAYHAIRTKFQPKDNKEHFVGFQDDDIDD